MMKTKIYWIPLLLTLTLSCQPNGEQADAYGNFEAIELLVSAEVQGKIVEFAPMEGDRLYKNQIVLVVDSTQLHLKKKQLETGVGSLRARINTLEAQIRAQRVQLANLTREKQRIDKLFEGGAATAKQQDDMNGQVALLEAQIMATESQKASVHAEWASLEVQIEQVEDQLLKCLVRNPLEGIILNKYKEEGEIAVPGQSLYKLANLDELILRAYVTGNQLSQIEIGKPVTVKYDTPEGLGQVSGEVTWVSSNAEFTPKIIQTREERVSLVYAIKVRVPNDGKLKIGMPGELLFKPTAR